MNRLAGKQIEGVPSFLKPRPPAAIFRVFCGGGPPADAASTYMEQFNATRLSSLAARGLCETCCHGKSTLLMLH